MNKITLLLPVLLITSCAQTPTQTPAQPQQRNNVENPDYLQARQDALSLDLIPYTVRLGENPEIQIAFHSPKIKDFTSKSSYNKKIHMAKAGNEGGFNLSIFSEKENQDINSHRDCRDKYWNKSKIPIQSFITQENVVSYEHFDLVRTNLKITIKEITMEQEDGHGYFFYKGHCIDFHASQVIIGEGDRPVLDSVFKTVLYQ